MAADESPEPLSGSLEGEENAPIASVVSMRRSSTLLEEMVDVNLSKELSDKMVVDESGGASDISEDAVEDGPIDGGLESDGETLNSKVLEQPAAPIQPRRSSRLAPLKKMPNFFKSAAPRRSSAGKKKPAVKKNGIFPLVRFRIH
jgi:hypothetical protein